MSLESTLSRMKFRKKYVPDQRAHRMLLQSLMVKNGFLPYPEEWWHFTLKNEPFPETYFDFPIEYKEPEAT